MEGLLLVLILAAVLGIFGQVVIFLFRLLVVGGFIVAWALLLPAILLAISNSHWHWTDIDPGYVLVPLLLAIPFAGIMAMNPHLPDRSASAPGHAAGTAHKPAAGSSPASGSGPIVPSGYKSPLTARPRQP